MLVRCERCKGPIRKGKRFCKPCAVQMAKEFGFDEYFAPEPDQEEVDLLAQYEKRHRIKTAAAIGIILFVTALAIWAVSGGA